MRNLFRSATITGLAVLLGSTALPVSAQTIEQRLYHAGDTILLSGSLGPGSDYQWFKGTAALSDSARITGTQTPDLTISQCVYDDAGFYLLLNTNTLFTTNSYSITNITQIDQDLITNIYVTNIVTTNMVVQTNAQYQVLIQDFPQILGFGTETRGDDIIFSVEATGGGLQYQWYWQDQLIPGATNSVLEYINAYMTANAGYYRVVVSNLRGSVTTPPPGLLFLKPAPRGKYEGIFLNETNPAVASSGRFEFNITSSKKAFSGKATILNQAYKFSGAFSDAHDAVVNATSKSSATVLTLKMQLLTTNNTAFVTGTVSDGSWFSGLRGHRLVYSTNMPAPSAGQYTIAVMNTNYFRPGETPEGSGVASVNIRMSGKVNMSGRLADGSPFTHSSWVSEAAEWPVYVPLNRNRGCLVGWFRFAESSGGSLQETPVYWMKDAGPDTYYPAGFNLELTPYGSSYTRGGMALPLEESVASLAGGDLFNEDLVVWTFIKVNQPQPNRLVPEKSTEKLTLSVSGSTGLISGKFTDHTTGLRTPIRAAVLQNQSMALGHFLSTNLSGYFSLSANGQGQ